MAKERSKNYEHSVIAIKKYHVLVLVFSISISTWSSMRPYITKPHGLTKKGPVCQKQVNSILAKLACDNMLSLYGETILIVCVSNTAYTS